VNVYLSFFGVQGTVGVVGQFEEIQHVELASGLSVRELTVQCSE